MFRAVKKGKEVMPSRWESSLKISKQSLLFRNIYIRSRCYPYDVICSYPALLYLSKNADNCHNKVNLVYNIYTATDSN